MRKKALPPTIPVEPEYPPLPPGTPTDPGADIPFICAVLSRVVEYLDDQAVEESKRRAHGAADATCREAVARAMAAAFTLPWGRTGFIPLVRRRDATKFANWDALNAKYYGKLNDKKQILVHFEKGDMSEDADVFTKYKVPFKTGVHQTKMAERDLVIAIDNILPPMQMTEAESAEMLKDAVTEEKLREIIATQKAKTKIVIEPAFRADLEKNFKK
jgi:hypothetical protein